MEEGIKVWVLYEKGKMVGISTSKHESERHMKNRQRIRHSEMEIKEHILSSPTPSKVKI